MILQGHLGFQKEINLHITPSHFQGSAMAQWLMHQTLDLKVGGSNLTGAVWCS